MKKISMLLIIILVAVSTLSSCGPKCKECRMSGPLGIDMSIGEQCGEDLKTAEKTEGITCD